ncbi:MAG: AAA family ATPase, partial [Chitinophagales bacterium]
KNTITKVVKKIAKEDYEKLKKIINLFLNTTLDRNANGEPTLFGFTLAKANLSDGQKILLQLCLAIHCQGAALDEVILFLDEPENHLHPEIIIETVERIIEHIPNGQVWIATHSIPLLSYFGASNIWYMADNKVNYAGNKPEEVLKSLLGDDEKIGKLQDFINEPGLMALHRHAFESLFMPEAVNTGSDDPQNLQIKDAVKAFIKDEKKVKILDYGAGKGRLLANVAEANAEPIESFRKWFDYVAYDEYDNDKAECLNKLESIYTDYKDRYFNDFTNLYSKYNKGRFDIVIMCNVLHEIDPKDWIDLFKKNGKISKLLSENGILLLVEDQEMPVGEKAYQKGFIVLDTPQIKELFKIEEEEIDDTFFDSKKNGRLKAHLIKKEFLMRIDAGSKQAALEDIHATAAEKIKAVRTIEANYKNGKKHGFWLQQYANTGLAIAENK